MSVNQHRKDPANRGRTASARPKRRFVLLGLGRGPVVLSLLWHFRRAIGVVVGVLVGAGAALLAAVFLLPPLLAFLTGMGISWPVLTFAVFAAAARLTGDHARPGTYLARLRTVARTHRAALSKGAAAAAAIGVAAGVSGVLMDGQSVLGALDVAAGSALALMVATVAVLEMATRGPDRPPPAATVKLNQVDAPGPRSATNRKQDAR